ncbi:MAG: HIT family protein [Actinobacteria bacterium]|jgi:histidine triad (HIT) family protein|nr:HIT family protein [Actinomycetota bacterium]MBT3746989.1 HIT family protein [Actinomycetota bacterium]MBT3970541.1 HIT family protein [Actinomycetota bacterium]MBT4010401.1 HIT family protein [Actinomycetota bacterium]MBT4302798.1 HIT family protein [Actinomycetota bacterium]
MVSIFTRIMEGEIPGRLVWEDDLCVAMVDIRPLNRGHVLIIPRQEADPWTALPAATAQHLMAVAHRVAQAQQELFSPQRVGLMVAGFEVPHTHLHCVPLDSMANLDFSLAQPGDPDDLDQVARVLREALN